MQREVKWEGQVARLQQHLKSAGALKACQKSYTQYYLHSVCNMLMHWQLNNVCNMQRRQESYMRREVKWEGQVTRLQQQLTQLKGETSHKAAQDAAEGQAKQLNTIRSVSLCDGEASDRRYAGIG